MPLIDLRYKTKGLYHMLIDHEHVLSMSTLTNPQYLDGHDALLEAALDLQL